MASSNVVDAFSEEENKFGGKSEELFSPEQLDRYQQAYDLAYRFGERKLREEGAQERQTIEKGASEQRKTERTQEARDNAQARRAYKF
jgi:hypothetical protein